MNTSKYKKEEGSVLVYMLIIIAVVMIIFTSMIEYVASQMNYSLYKASREESLQIAEAGIYFYQWYLAHEVEGKTASQVKDFWEGGSAYGVGTPYEVEYNDPQGAAIGKFSINVTPPDTSSTIVWVESTGWTYKRPDFSRTIKVRFRRPSWSEYMILADERMRLSSTTEIFGKFHSNGGIHFDGVAHNVLSSSVTSYYDSDSDVQATMPGVWTAWPSEYNTTLGNDVFLAGKEMGVPGEDFNGAVADLSVMQSIAIAGTDGIYFDNSGNGRHIILKTDGTFDVRTVSSYNIAFDNITSYSGSWQNYNIPDNGIIYVEDNVWLEGQIDGDKVTIVAADLIGGSSPNLFIEHDIKYTNYDGSDVIGIIAENDVNFIKTCEDNLEVDGALLAQSGEVGRDYYSLYYGGGYYYGCGWSPNDDSWTWRCGTNWYMCQGGGCMDYKDTISIYGSIASKLRFGFGFTNGTGFQNRNLNYDNNLLYYPPPYFPTGNEYSLDLWDEL